MLIWHRCFLITTQNLKKNAINKSNSTDTVVINWALIWTVLNIPVVGPGYCETPPSSHSSSCQCCSAADASVWRQLMSGGPCPRSKYFLPDGRGEAIKFTQSGYSAGQDNSRFLSTAVIFCASDPHAHSVQRACLLTSEQSNGRSSFQTSQRTVRKKTDRQECRKTGA